MSNGVRLLFGLAAACAFTAAPAAAGQWPSSIVGVWSGEDNLSPIGVAITAQGSGRPCPEITGTLGNVGQNTGYTIQGFYCPNTGRIAFERIWGDGVQFACQVYTGNVSSSGSTLFIAGVFSVVNTCGGPFGDYSYYLRK